MLNIKEIIDRLNNAKILPFKITEWKELTGGTSSSVWMLLGDNKEKYVLKSNEDDVIKEESQFLTTYKNVNMLPEVVYVGEKYEYFIYKYMPGEINPAMIDKTEMLTKLVNEVISKYQPLGDKWGWTWDSHQNWNEFLLTEIGNAKEIVGRVLTKDDFQLVKQLCQKDIRRNGVEKAYLLHGDCGVHNFLQKDGKLVGVIDPMPLAGPPLYELVFAFCSSPEQLTMEVIYEAASILPNFHISKMHLIEEVIIGIYIRLLRCIYHHPHDLPEYLNAWVYWNRLLERSATVN
ncbi:phosphotransferase [Lederbergia citrea]|uniref:Phosphotransferase n=1 Tax=Lederbergia citrea TaxID=2833581 RepID=A0A942Z3D0_9BACI|nr:phosphotransferase [Lederbergia citrea]MBS4177355.1 phosphotransferase [Lederbergia citrea]MBS4204018.1 phosphotransferase [Lederbergia citrea]MBS4221397.1 phosphotransferase [Lederbergia citrea]